MIEEVIVNLLCNRNETVSSMESCTGGNLVNKITNVPGSHNVFKFSAITYSNEYKIRLGVNKDIILKYSVYSKETAKEMAYKISYFSESTYGIGITGKIEKGSKIYVCIYNSKKNKFTNLLIKCPYDKRDKCKDYIVNKTLNLLLKIINENK